MSRAMVTGGAGFIGSHIVDHLLADGYRVCVVADLSTGSVHNVAAGAALRQVDVRDLGSLRSVMESFKPEVVFHAAAQMDVRRSIREPEFDASVNVLGGLNVLRAAVAAGTRRIVYASTAAVYGNPARLPVVETDPTHPISEYGQQARLRTLSGCLRSPRTNRVRGIAVPKRIRSAPASQRGGRRRGHFHAPDAAR